MPRRKAILIHTNGYREGTSVWKVKKMLEAGEAELVQERPLMARELRDPHYKDVLRYHWGEFRGGTTHRFNRHSTKSRVIRCRPRYWTSKQDAARRIA